MIRALGARIVRFVSVVGEIMALVGRTVRFLFKAPFPLRSLFQQMVRIGWESVPVTFFTALATGAILALQTGYSLMVRIKGTEQFVGGIVALAVTRELGPVLCALMIAGRCGSGITAEIGTMKVTEQLDALVTLSTDPVHYLVVPRVLAGLVMLPILTIFTDLIALTGGMLVSVYELGLNQAQYIHMTRRFLTMPDVVNGLIKSAIFGILITLLACYEGFRTRGGAEGVGKSTTRAVVVISMSILFFDYILTSILTTSF